MPVRSVDFNSAEKNIHSSKHLKLAYLTTTYPSVSHTFIRRELRKIEELGHSVLRLAIRRPAESLVDPLDQEEEARTIHCLAQSLWFHLVATFRVLVLRPRHFMDAFKVAITMGMRSDRSIFKHLAYLVEACTFLNIMRQYAIEHVHVHFGTNSATVARLMKRCGGPTYSFTVHGPTEFDSVVAFDLSGKIVDAAFVIAITDYCRAQLFRWSSPDEWKKIHIIRCNVGDDFFGPIEPIDLESKIFVCVGRITPQKGQIILLEAFAQLVKKGYKTKLIFVGDGEIRALIEQKIIELGIQEHVIITGYVSEADVRKHIASSRALVLPSFAEGLPMVIMESFAVGRPVISTYVAGIPELVLPGENGWLVPAGNVEKLEQAMIDVLETPVEKLEEMATAGRELTYQNHRTVTEVDRLEKLLIRYSNSEDY